MVQANCSLSNWTNAGSEKRHYKFLSYRISTSTRAAATNHPYSPPSAQAIQIGKSGDEREMHVVST